jgi:myo-inositol 2-dehydrogenase/D-chiro-inositol 1-dehydrogenase
MDQNSNIITRRRFSKGIMAASLVAGFGGLTANAEEPVKPKFDRKIKLGIVGLGSRGNFISNFCRAHGGYEITAVADYFDHVAKKHGKKLGVPQDKIFSGLSGYKRVLDSGVEAILIMDVPYFYPEQATAAIDAGCHVYVAKPYAIDVPGVMTMQAAAKKATENKLCFLVDYQLPLDPANKEVAKRIQEGGLGTLGHIYSSGLGGPWPDRRNEATIANLLQNWGWLTRINLGGDDIVSYDIHIIDGVTFAMKKRPVSAFGTSSVLGKRNGDTTNCGNVIYQYDDGVSWTHVTQALKNNATIYDLGADLMGTQATAHISYTEKVYLRGGPKHYVSAASKTIYNDGAITNVADFYRCVTQGDFSNPTAKRAVDGTLTAILGREAAARRTFLTMDELIKENKKLEVNLKGLKA